MVFLGVDPGSARTGFGVIDSQSGVLRHVAHGVVQADSSRPLPHRLQRIHHRILELLEFHRPASVAVEAIFHARNAKSSLILGHARGVILLACVDAGLDVHEYSPRQVKQALTGYGQADKEQIRFMVRSLLGLQESPPLDASDALAVAVCHAHCETGRRWMVKPP
jgi:crossover junction endodeoxyribonuclease RuvC